MNARAFVSAVAATALLSLPSAAAAAAAPDDAALDADAIDSAARAAFEEGDYAFCESPPKPLVGRQRDLCALAFEIDGCEGYAKACDATPAQQLESRWLERLLSWAAPIARYGIYFVVGAIAVALAIPVVRALWALWRGRRRREETTESEAANQAVVVPPEAPLQAEDAEAEALLHLAHEHQARGDLRRALALYLAAALAALDRRGAIRLARHRTNGEYVRSCTDEAARPLLHEIVREAEKTSFGGAPPTDAGVGRAAERAQTIVRRVAVLSLLLLSACSSTTSRSDPAGDELPREVLRRSGFVVEEPTSPLAAMPFVGEHEPAPVLVVDLERVPLDADAKAHLVRWVEAGGALVLFGRPGSWPSVLEADAEEAETRDLVVRVPEKARTTPLDPPLVEVRGARLARAHAFVWKEDAADAVPIGFVSDRLYAAKRRLGRGVVVGVANSDLFTNVGVLPPRNATALVALIEAAADSGGVAGREVRVARPEHGTAPPANPLASLDAAGLGKGTWHALGASLLLFLAYGIRRARPRPVEKRTRRAFVEHVEATGAFYARARAHSHALAAYGRYVEMRLRDLLPRGADPAEFLAERSGASPERVAELYARARQSSAADERRGDELRVIEELSQIVARAMATAGSESDDRARGGR